MRAFRSLTVVLTLLASAGSVQLTLTASAQEVVAGAPVESIAAKAPVLSAGVFGKKKTMFAPRLITARATTLRVGGKKCGIAAGTPLAALAALRRIGGPSFRLKDYGSCTRSTKNSSGLFVVAIGGVRNRGQDGWVYSVNGRSGTAGAADSTGPFGSGLISAGSKVRWYWCSLSKKKRC